MSIRNKIMSIERMKSSETYTRTQSYWRKTNETDI